MKTISGVSSGFWIKPTTKMRNRHTYSYGHAIPGTYDRHGEPLMLDIEYRFIPGEPETRVDPSTDDSIEIETISLNDHDMSDFLDSHNYDFDALKQEIMENHAE